MRREMAELGLMPRIQSPLLSDFFLCPEVYPLGCFIGQTLDLQIDNSNLPANCANKYRALAGLCSG